MAYTIDEFTPNKLVAKHKDFTVTSSQAERQDRKRNAKEPDHDDTLQGVEEAFRRAAENRKKIKTRNV